MSVNPSLITPERDPSLIRRIANFVFRADPSLGPQPAQKQTTQSGIQAEAFVNLTDKLFRVRQGRTMVYLDAEEMDDTSEEVSVALDILADNATTSDDGEQESFTVTSEDQAVLDEIQEINANAHLEDEAYSLIRNLLKYGDSFSEIVVNGEGDIVALAQLPPRTMHRNEDAEGNLMLGEPKYDESGKCLNKMGECAFEQRNPDTDEVLAAFYPWQIVHIRHNWDGMSLYGRSHLRVARIIWRKLKAVDEAIIIARLVRAYPKLLHEIDTTGLSPNEAKSAIHNYIRGIRQQTSVGASRDKDFSVTSDIYVGRAMLTGPDDKLVANSSKVSLLEADGGTIYNIDDVKNYLAVKLRSVLRVPSAYYNWEEQINAKATLTGQDIEYVRFLRRLQKLCGEALEQVYTVGLVLAGMDPNTAEYEITWPGLKSNDDQAQAVAYFNEAQGDQIYAGLGTIDNEWLRRNRFEMDDDELAEMAAREDAANAEAEAAAKAQAAQTPAGAMPAEEREPVVQHSNGNGKGNGNGHYDPQLWGELAEIKGEIGAFRASKAQGPTPTTILQIGDGSLTEAVAAQMAADVRALREEAALALENSGAKIIGKAVQLTADATDRGEAAIQQAATAGVQTLEQSATTAHVTVTEAAREEAKKLGRITQGVEQATSRADAAAARAEKAQKAAQATVDAAKAAIYQEVQTLIDQGALGALAEDGDASVSIEYDRAGKVLGATTPDGRFIKVDYDARGRVIGARESNQPYPKE